MFFPHPHPLAAGACKVVKQGVEGSVCFVLVAPIHRVRTRKVKGEVGEGGREEGEAD